MEQITRRDGVYYYGERRCMDVEAAYRYFRTDYNEAIGKVAANRLSRYGSRKERIHDIGIVCREVPQCPIRCEEIVPVMHLGMLAGCYCKSVDGADIPEEVNGDNLLDWVNWVFCRGHRHYRIVDLKYKAGRTSKLYRMRF